MARQVSTETREKISKSHLGQKRSPQHRENIRKAKLGKKRLGWKIKDTSKMKGKTPWNKGIPMSEKTKEKLSKARIGKTAKEKNPNWKGGVTPIHQKIRCSKEYKLWRDAVFQRDEYTCIWCFSKNGNGKTVILNADHIKPFALYPELRFAIDNGRTLCRPCHEKTFKENRKLEKKLRDLLT